MKNISKAIGYALLASGYIAQHSQEGAVEASDISQQCNIPPLYLFKILGKLLKANILLSKRGPGGGFTLARPAKDITILEIIEAVDKPMVNYQQLADFTSNKPFILKMKKVYQSATEKAIEIYGKAKFSDMVK
jgi:Rrf2 family protein